MRLGFLVLLMLLITACSSINHSNTAIPLDQYSQYYLQKIPTALHNQASLQKLTITSAQGKHELLLQTELRENTISMVGLSPAGLVLFNMRWSVEAGLTVESKVALNELKPEIMLAFYQLAVWPLTDIQAGLSGLKVSLSPSDNRKREFYLHDVLIFSVLHQEQHSQMIHLRDHYQIDILTLQQTQLEN
ncbi:DUF3261 domain-containing protein [Paraglaciecola hydrolytica]|nr:DUF3261 domain-containing protein [Paraglaciecola hydrolytica]